MVDTQTPDGEKFDVGIDVLFVEILIFIVCVNELFSSRSACKDEGKGERESVARITVQRKGAGKKLLRALRLMTLLTLSVGRSDKLSAVRQALMSLMVGSISWMESSAALWSTMTGMDAGPVPTRHPTLFVGRRRVPPKLWGLWRLVIPFVLLATRMTLKGCLSCVIFRWSLLQSPSRR